MKKEIKVVYGLIYDDELNKRMGLNRFYHLNGDIETDADGNEIYICSRWNEETKQIEDVAERVDNLVGSVAEIYSSVIFKSSRL